MADIRVIVARAKAVGGAVIAAECVAIEALRFGRHGAEARCAAGISNSPIRLSIALEAEADLIADLQRTLIAVNISKGS